MLGGVFLGLAALFLVVVIILQFVGVDRMRKADYKDTEAAIYSSVAFCVLALLFLGISAYSEHQSKPAESK